MIANETIGIGIEARLEAFKSSLAEIPGIGAKEAKELATKLSQEIKAAEKASKAAEAAAKAAKKETGDAADATGELGDRAGKAGAIFGQLGGAIGGVSPEVGALISGLTMFSDGAEAAAGVSESLGVSLRSVLVVGGALVAGLALVAGAYALISRETTKLNDMRQFQEEVSISLRASELALRDALLDQKVAQGALTELAREEVGLRLAASDAVRDFADAQKESRHNLRDQIDSTEVYLGVLEDTIKTLVYIGALAAAPFIWPDLLIEGPEKFKQNLDNLAGSITSGIDSVLGWRDSIETARSKLDQLDQAVVLEAGNQKKLREIHIQTAGAVSEASESYSDLTDQIERYRAALEGISEIQAGATEDQLSELDRLQAARQASLSKLARLEKEALDSRLGDAEALRELDQASASARLAIEARYQRDKEALDQKAAEEEEKRRLERERLSEEEKRKTLDRERALQEERKKIQDSLLNYGKQALSQLSSGLESTASQAAATALALSDRLVSLEGFITESQREQIAKRIEASTKAAKRAFEVTKIAKLAEAAVNTYTAATAALGSAPPPFNFINAGIVTAAGVASMAQIAAQQPAFHSGGPVNLAPDEGLRTVRNNEYVSNPTGRSLLGDRTLAGANAGVKPDTRMVVVSVYQHTRQVDQYERDRLAAGNPVAQAILSQKRPGIG
jgi:hypothetical protein